MIHVHVSHQIKQLCGLFFRKQINVKPISGIIFVASYYSAGFLLLIEFIGLLFMKSTSFLKSSTHEGLLRRTFRMNEKPIMYTIVNFQRSIREIEESILVCYEFHVFIK